MRLKEENARRMAVNSKVEGGIMQKLSSLREASHLALLLSVVVRMGGLTRNTETVAAAELGPLGFTLMLRGGRFAGSPHSANPAASAFDDGTRSPLPQRFQVTDVNHGVLCGIKEDGNSDDTVGDHSGVGQEAVETCNGLWTIRSNSSKNFVTNSVPDDGTAATNGQMFVQMLPKYTFAWGRVIVIGETRSTKTWKCKYCQRTFTSHGRVTVEKHLTGIGKTGGNPCRNMTTAQRVAEVEAFAKCEADCLRRKRGRPQQGGAATASRQLQAVTAAVQVRRGGGVTPWGAGEEGMADEGKESAVEGAGVLAVTVQPDQEYRDDLLVRFKSYLNEGNTIYREAIYTGDIYRRYIEVLILHYYICACQPAI